VLATSALILAVSVLTPPSGSHDMWSYVMYGRMVAVHHQDPYTSSPRVDRTDPLLRDVGRGWRGSRSVYGPAFTAVSAAGAELSGTSPLRNRLFHQGLAALVVLAALIALRRRSGDPTALILLGLSPPVAAIVNTGQNDVVVGGLLLAGLLALRRRPAMVAGVLLALAALVKLVALLPAGLLTIWAWRHQGRARAVALAGTVVATTVAAYVVAGGIDALRPLLDQSHRMSRASIWRVARYVTTETHVLRLAQPSASELTRLAFVLAPFALGALVCAALALTNRADPAPCAVAGALAFVLAWPYVMPGYALWSLIAAAGAARHWTARAAMAVSSALALAYVQRPGLAPRGGLLGALSAGAPIVGLAVMALLEHLQRRPPSRPADGAPAVVAV
jgi:hypothetical protein